jgi:hypothetical protein
MFLPFIFIIVNLAILASVILLPISTLSIAVTFPIMVVTVIVSFEFSNAMKIFFTNSLFANVVPLFPLTISGNSATTLLPNIGYYEVLFFFLYIIMIAAKAKMGGGGGGGTYGGGGPNYGGTIGFG